MPTAAAPLRTLVRIGLATITAICVGCGSAAPPGSCRPAATATAPEASGTGVSAMADRALVGDGGTVTFTVVARGPLSFHAACDAPLQLVVDDSTQLGVYAGSAPAGPHSPCGAVSLKAATTAVYSAAWTVDAHLPSGTYTATLALGDLPGLRLTVRVGEVRASC